MVSSPYKANAKQIIMASYIGMSSVEMPASSMIFKLSEAANELESIVVVDTEH
jgi:hypothetical protein